MKAMFNKTKVKSWIKKAHKNQSLVYGHGYITNKHVILVEEPHMHPTILEVYGTLSPECKYSVEQFQRLIDVPDEPIRVIDSQLELVLEPKYRLHIFYDPKTGRELTVDSVYFDLLDNPRNCTFYTNDTMSMLWIICGNEVIGVIAPCRLRGQLSHISFKAENEAS